MLAPQALQSPRWGLPWPQAQAAGSPPKGTETYLCSPFRSPSSAGKFNGSWPEDVGPLQIPKPGEPIWGFRPYFLPFPQASWKMGFLKPWSCNQPPKDTKQQQQIASMGDRLQRTSGIEMHARCPLRWFLPGSGSCKQELSSELGAAGVVTDHPTLLSGCMICIGAGTHAQGILPPLFTASCSPPPSFLSPIPSQVIPAE